ncbi:MAG: HAMP domain-containing protein [Myxococcales bacterium]|nr:HAMP domain-containing protein [Myxococcales bacterium]
MSEAPAAGRRSSLRLELIAMLAIVLVMAVVSLSFAAEWLGQRRHDQQEVERLQGYARQLAVLAAANFRGGDFERDGLEELLASSAGLQGVSFEVHRLRTDGALEQIAAVGIHAGFAELPEPDPELRAAVDEDLLERWNLLIIDEPIPTLDQQRVLLRMIAEHSPWTRSHDWRETLIVAGGVGLLLLVLGGALLELQVLRPTRALGKAVAELGAGRLDVRAPTDGPAELRELAERFNAMTASLREQQQTLETQTQRLQRSERLAAIGRLAAGVAHEVGNPLAAIVGYTDLLLDDPAQSEDNKDLLRRVAAQTQRIQGIVGQLLDYAKPAQQQRIRFAPLSRAQEVLALLRADPRCVGVELELIGDPTVEVDADPALVEQILINLVLNGAQAARESTEAPKVAVRVRSEASGAVAIEVDDNGPGVSEAVRERLFEPFFTTRAAGQGTGLGLAISQGLAERMEAGLEYVPTGDRPGARFRLRFKATAN